MTENFVYRSTKFDHGVLAFHDHLCYRTRASRVISHQQFAGDWRVNRWRIGRLLLLKVKTWQPCLLRLARIIIRAEISLTWLICHSTLAMLCESSSYCVANERRTFLKLVVCLQKQAEIFWKNVFRGIYFSLIWEISRVKQKKDQA